MSASVNLVSLPIPLNKFGTLIEVFQQLVFPFPANEEVVSQPDNQLNWQIYTLETSLQ